MLWCCVLGYFPVVCCVSAELARGSSVESIHSTLSDMQEACIFFTSDMLPRILYERRLENVDLNHRNLRAGCKYGLHERDYVPGASLVKFVPR